MMKREHKIPYEIHEQVDSLPEADQTLLAEAMKAAGNSYAPYSDFNVGCAILLKNGDIVHGSNQENAAYPSGLCAERVALFSIGAMGREKEVLAIAIRARTTDRIVDKPPTSCGDCRQVMLEFEQRARQPFTVLFQGEKGPVLKVKGIAGGLLPFPFEF